VKCLECFQPLGSWEGEGREGEERETFCMEYTVVFIYLFIASRTCATETDVCLSVCLSLSNNLKRDLLDPVCHAMWWRWLTSGILNSNFKSFDLVRLWSKVHKKS